MRFTRIATAVSLGLGAALLAAPALAGPSVSPLLEGRFFIQGDDVDHTLCAISANTGSFGAYEELDGQGTGGEKVVVGVSAAQPTSVSRSADKLSVKQSQFAALTVALNGVIVVSGVPIEKCSINSSFSKHNAHGVLSVRCKGDDLSALLTADQIASLKTAVQQPKHVKFALDNANAKWSLSMDCSGTWFP